MVKSGVTITTSTGESVEDMFKDAGDSAVIATAQGLVDAGDKIGFLISSKYSVSGQGFANALSAPVDPFRWTSRTGKLIRSYLQKFTFSATKFPSSVKVKRLAESGLISATQLRGTVKTTQKTGGQEGVRELKYNKGAGKIDHWVGSKVPYAIYLEEGTEKMRARPSLEPARKEVEGEIEMMIKRRYDAIIRGLGWKGR